MKLCTWEKVDLPSSVWWWCFMPWNMSLVCSWKLFALYMWKYFILWKLRVLFYSCSFVSFYNFQCWFNFCRPVTYQEYRERTQETAAHASGWNKVPNKWLSLYLLCQLFRKHEGVHTWFQELSQMTWSFIVEQHANL